ncbi:MAG TPA: LapA family protein [Gemmataceae bacterium]|nr:LapA family protein [Gemmataceae bacterium]
MRFFYFLLLVLFLGAVTVFAVQNMDPITIKYLNREGSFPLAVIIGAVYVLGMFSGWTVVGMIRRSFQRVTERA